MAKYYFAEIETGQIREEYTVIEVVGHYAEIPNDDESAMLLAEKNGGVIEVKPAPLPATKAVLKPPTEEVPTNG